mmetsp:Transcript_11872/g.22617  ORF Transcript_11872/g.22617 Transcript_11872/m.22617 type:complete len:105 (-) Transcript_11872:42-356(-)
MDPSQPPCPCRRDAPPPGSASLALPSPVSRLSACSTARAWWCELLRVAPAGPQVLTHEVAGVDGPFTAPMPLPPGCPSPWVRLARPAQSCVASLSLLHRARLVV